MTNKYAIFFISINIIFFVKGAEEIEGRIRIDQNKNWIIETKNFSDEYSYIATAFYNPSMEETGWDTLSLTTNKIFKDEIQAEGAGRLEASLTKDRIYSHYKNLLTTIGSLSVEVEKFFRDNEFYLIDQRKKHPDDPIFYNAYLLYLQFKGIRDQYYLEASPDKYIKDVDFYIVNAFGDLLDVNSKFTPPNFKNMTLEELHEYFLLNTHCSAMYKIKYDLKDIFFGHDAWYYYNMMTRIFKEYNLNFNDPSIKTHNVMFSSYPGSIVSNDDFYVTSSNLGVIETSLSNFNETSLIHISEFSLLCWHRVQIANRMASNAKEWAEIFVQHNSGTYNNQYMVLDYSKVDLFNGTVESGAFYVVEQMPGLYDIIDATDEFKFGYFPSYNLPLSQKIFNYSLLNEIIETKGESARASYDYNTCTRANIMRRDQTNITDVESMKTFMRYNNYLNDPYALNSPTNTIAARGDLRNPRPVCFGAFDTKFASVSELQSDEKTIHLYSGPTSDNVPKFDFNCDACKNIGHEGIPDSPNFDWITYHNKFKFDEI